MSDTNYLFYNLTAVVQYRRVVQDSRKDGGSWQTMAAFDSMYVAERCAQDNSSIPSQFEYRAVAIENLLAPVEQK